MIWAIVIAACLVYGFGFDYFTKRRNRRRAERFGDYVIERAKRDVHF